MQPWANDSTADAAMNATARTVMARRCARIAADPTVVSRGNPYCEQISGGSASLAPVSAERALWMPTAKYGGADPDDGGPFLDCNFEIGAHAHRQFAQHS